jgi:hypothetical protein
MQKKKKRTDFGFEIFTKPLKKPRIIASSGIIVTYVFADPRPYQLIKNHLSPEATDEQIIAILRENPDADLGKFEEPLGIKILNAQRKPVPKPKEDEKKDTPEWWT